MTITRELVAASAVPLVLSILSEGESYGYAIIKRVRELSGDQLQWTDGMLYPVLHRLEKLGQISARWRVAESGRKRKYYRIKQSGTKALKAQQDQWQAVTATLMKLWETKPCLS